MTICDPADALFKFLNSKGYVPISVPQGRMDPPVAYILDGETFHVLRSRENMFPDRKLVPGLKVQEVAAADFEQAMSRKSSGKASVSFLSGVLRTFGLGEAPQAHLEGGIADSRQLAFKKVTLKRVDPGAVLDALVGYDPAKFGLKYLESGAVHVAYAFLYSGALEVKVGDHAKAGFSAKTDVESLALLDIGVSRGVKNGEGLTSRKPVAFAVRLVRLGWRDGAYHLDFNVGGGLEAIEVTEPAFVPRAGLVYDVAD